MSDRDDDRLVERVLEPAHQRVHRLLVVDGHDDDELAPPDPADGVLRPAGPR